MLSACRAAFFQLLDTGYVVIDAFGPKPVQLDSRNSRFRVLFVCHGNVCRSPMAEGVFRYLIARQGLSALVAVDSAGTVKQNVGKRPDWRARACTRKRGISIRDLRARQFATKDFDLFTRIIVMDRRNLFDVMRLARNEKDRSKVTLLLDYVPEAMGQEIVDPYGKGCEYFQHTYNLIEKGCICLLEHFVLSEGRISETI